MGRQRQTFSKGCFGGTQRRINDSGTFCKVSSSSESDYSVEKILQKMQQVFLNGRTRKARTNAKRRKKIKNVQIQHPEKGYRRIFQDLKAAVEDVTGKQDYTVSESGMVNGYNIHQTSDRQRLSYGNNRLVQPESFEMAAVQYNGHRTVCTAFEGDNHEFGCPAVFNTNQGVQFTSEVFQKVLEDNNIEISMDGRNRALNNIRIERLWRSLKYEDIYFKRYETMTELKAGVNAYFNYLQQGKISSELGLPYSR